jgi:hypothetical protein
VAGEVLLELVPAHAFRELVIFRGWRRGQLLLLLLLLLLLRLLLGLLRRRLLLRCHPTALRRRVTGVRCTHPRGLGLAGTIGTANNPRARQR